LALLQKDLQVAEKAVEDAHEVVRDLQRKFEVLDDAD
jgi:hypothetical protein